MRRPCHVHHHPQGFTLMEMVISVALLGILGVVGTSMLTSGFYTSNVLTNEHLYLAQARHAMERMSREIREIQPNSSSRPTIGIMNATVLNFTRSNLMPLGLGTEVQFSFDAATATVNMASRDLNVSPLPALTAVPLATHVQSLKFSYFANYNDTPYVAATTPPSSTELAARYVRIEMNLQPNPQQTPVKLVTQVRLRNL